jgi:hypothetical protein
MSGLRQGDRRWTHTWNLSRAADILASKAAISSTYFSALGPLKTFKMLLEDLVDRAVWVRTTSRASVRTLGTMADFRLRTCMACVTARTQ